MLVANILNEIELKHIYRGRLERQYANNINYENKQEQVNRQENTINQKQAVS